VNNITIKNGNNNNNSTSKIRKIKATIKNRKEKGNRPSSLVENPHSKGLLISRSKKFFFLKIKPSSLKTNDKSKQTKLIKININMNDLLQRSIKNLDFNNI
jgi:hypothetical protein